MTGRGKKINRKRPAPAKGSREGASSRKSGIGDTARGRSSREGGREGGELLHYAEPGEREFSHLAQGFDHSVALTVSAQG